MQRQIALLLTLSPKTISCRDYKSSYMACARCMSCCICPVLLVALHSSSRGFTILQVAGMLRFSSDDMNQLSLPTAFILFVVTHFRLYGPFNYISFHKFFKPFSALSLCSSSLIGGLPDWSFQLYIPLPKSPCLVV